MNKLMREEFEAWAKVVGLDLKKWGGYCDKETWLAWFGWRAAWEYRNKDTSPFDVVDKAMQDAGIWSDPTKTTESQGRERDVAEICEDIGDMVEAFHKED